MLLKQYLALHYTYFCDWESWKFGKLDNTSYLLTHSIHDMITIKTF